MKTVAIQGIQGSFHDQAASLFFGSEKLSLIQAETFRQVFEAVSSGDADYGVVAIENSLHGPLNPVYRLLASEKLWVCGEVRLHINMFLSASKQGSLQQLNKPTTQVLSHNAALSQCELWLNAHLPLAKRSEVIDTAEAVRMVMERPDEDLLGISSKQATAIFGATVLAGPINDEVENYTRFFILCKKPQTSADADRTSIILNEADRDKPGSLYLALTVFNDAGINLSKLDSHPLPGTQRRYSFYIDFDAGLQQPETQTAIEKLKNSGWDVQILGSYSRKAKNKA